MAMKTRDIVYISLFAALTAALAYVPAIPVPGISVPITAQTLGVMLAGGILGGVRGALALVLFLVLVLASIAVLASGNSGPAAFVGPAGGFVIGWPFGAFVVGWLTERLWSAEYRSLAGFSWDYISAVLSCISGGIVVVYLFGIPWLGYATQMGFYKAAVFSMTFVPGDLIKVGIAAMVMVAVKRGYPLIALRA